MESAAFVLDRCACLWQDVRTMYGHVIITGASSGFGMAFARRLVGECAPMVLVARRKEVLMELSDELQAANPSLKVTVKACDLSSPSVRDSLVEELQSLPEGKMLLINNAGLGDYGEYMSSTPARNNQMLQVNVLAVAELTRAVLPRLVSQGGRYHQYCIAGCRFVYSGFCSICCIQGICGIIFRGCAA